METYRLIDGDQPLSEAEIEAAVGIFGGPTVEDPETDLQATPGPLPSDADEQAAPPPEESCG